MSDPRPNILLITADQHRGDCLGCAGHPCVRTPHLDRLAYAGVRFANAYSDCPICIPARTTMISGLKSSTYGAPGYCADFRLDRPRRDLLGGLLTEAGYQTALVGKRHWHLPPSHKAGFETVIPIERCKRQQNLASGRDGQPHGLGANEVSPSRWTMPEGLYSTDWTTDRCLEWLRERETDRPFLLWASYVDPHPPFAIHEPYYSMYAHSPIPAPAIGDWVHGPTCPAEQVEHRTMYNPGPMGADELRQARAVYYGLITNLDHNLGRLFGMLMNLDLWQNTLVVYTCDHGEHLGDHLDLAKSSFCNAAARVPFLLRPPAAWNWRPGQVSPALVELADLLPTLCTAAGARIPDDVEGHDLRPLGEGRSAVRDLLFGQVDGRHLVHDGTWKWIYHVMDGREQLFRADDQDDLHDATAEQPEVCARLRQALIARLARLGHPHQRDGALLNQGRTARPLEVLRALDVSGLDFAARHLEFRRPV
jgi:arylsulfatase A-like enzyme